METILTQKINEVKKAKNFLEKELNIKISIEGKIISFEGEPLEEYEASRIFDAINVGFPIKTAMLLKEEGYIFEKIKIKDYTRRKNLEVVRGRIIGTHGKTKSTLEEISGCQIKITDREVGLIGRSESIKYAITAIINIIKGSKQKNAYKYLERINTSKKTKKSV